MLLFDVRFGSLGARSWLELPRILVVLYVPTVASTVKLNPTIASLLLLLFQIYISSVRMPSCCFSVAINGEMNERPKYPIAMRRGTRFY